MQQTPYAPSTQGPSAPVSSWDPATPGGNPTYDSVPGTFPGQSYAYIAQTSPGIPQVSGTQPLHQPNVFPGGASILSRPPYYGS